MLLPRFVFGLALALPVSAMRLAAQSSATVVPTGLWGGQLSAANQLLRGDVSLRRAGAQWVLRHARGVDTATQVGDSLVIKVANSGGTLRAWVSGAGLDAFWVQPPQFDGPSYATPIKFQRADAHHWTGSLRPLESRFTLFVHLARAADSSVTAVLRNTEANWPGPVGAMPVRVEPSTMVFLNPRTGAVQWRQPFNATTNTLTFDFGAPLELTPQSERTAVGWVAVDQYRAPYTYRPPVRDTDQWPVARAATYGFRELALRDLVRRLQATDPRALRTPRVHSLVIARRGHLVLDEYFYGYDRSQLHDTRSASKTWTSVLLGAVIHRGAPLTLASPIDTAPRLRGITIGHLLTHASGLDCNDDDSASPGGEDRMQSQRALGWYAFTRALPRVRDPGTQYSYCSAGINLVGQQIGAATRQWLPRVFDRTVAAPLGITHYAMNLMPDGEMYAGGGMQMTPRDLLKFGQLYLDGGVWRGHRLVSSAWVAQTTGKQITRPDSSTDGFGWHRHDLRVGARTIPTYEASGNGGQMVVVVPSAQLCIAITAGNYGEYAVWQRLRTELVPDIIQAISAERSK
ncbi:MAG: beta-lactamase family protein [Gemmatimonadaceae bacterium]|nr:beta-lactamase family protein [Gemmatimonadaceae bacterium]